MILVSDSLSSMNTIGRVGGFEKESLSIITNGCECSDILSNMSDLKHDSHRLNYEKISAVFSSFHDQVVELEVDSREEDEDQYSSSIE